MLRRSTATRASGIPTLFIRPSFSKDEKNKVNNRIEILSRHELAYAATSRSDSVPAIASEGFPADRIGRVVFATYVQTMGKEPNINVGFTSTQAQSDSNTKCACPGTGAMNGVVLAVKTGILFGGTGNDDVCGEFWTRDGYFAPSIGDNAKEVVAILTISSTNDGCISRSVQYIVDGQECPIHQLSTCDFENKNGGNDIFPVVTLSRQGQHILCVPFDQLESRSPLIQELMEEFEVKKNNFATAETDAVISKLGVTNK